MGKRKVRYDRIALFILVPVIAITGVVSCGTAKLKKSSVDNITAENTSEIQTESETETVLQDKTVNIVAIGDNLVQTKVYEAAEEHAENGENYNFGYTYSAVRELISSGDLNIINQETPICNDEYEITGSNFDFNSPKELGEQLIEMGVNVFSVCNNGSGQLADFVI